MCLVVTHVPQNKLSGLIGTGYKDLKYDYFYERFHTPYIRTIVPNTGWLLPNKQSMRVNYHYGHSIHGGHIHYYQYKSSSLDDKPVFTFFNSAYEYSADGVCRAMYIPCCDKTGSNTKKVIRRLLERHKKGTLRTNDITRAFPFLQPAYAAYKKIQF